MKNFLIIFCSILFSFTSFSAYGYGSHTFEGTDQVFDRPYIANESANAYLCIPNQQTPKTTTTQTVNQNGDKVTVVTSPESDFPLLYEQVSSKWFLAGANPSYNNVGNPCSKGEESIWFNNITFAVQNTTSSPKNQMTVTLATPITKILTTTKHHMFLWKYSTSTVTTYGGGKGIISGIVTVYRTARDATDDLVGTNTQFFHDINYVSKEDIYTNWFPNSFDPGP